MRGEIENVCISIVGSDRQKGLQFADQRNFADLQRSDHELLGLVVEDWQTIFDICDLKLRLSHVF